MTKLQIILICLVSSVASSVLTTAVVFHYFLPGNQPGALASAQIASFAPDVPPVVSGVDSPAAAQSPVQRSIPGMQNCREDMAKLCENDKSVAVPQCLQDHFEEVSRDCHKTLQAMRDSFLPCQSEVAQYCANAGYGGGRMMKCLREHQAHLSAGCTGVVSKGP